MADTKDPFDFTDVSDLPEDLQGKLQKPTSNTAQEYANIVIKGAEAGYSELSINHIIAAAIRMGMEVPSQQTVRGYLNKAVELKLISKPGRQTYGVGTKAKNSKAELVVADDAVATQEVAEVPKTDPLADL